MRVVLLLLKTFAFIAGIVALVFFGGREVLLLMTKYQIQNEVEKLRAGTKSNNEYAVTCTKMFSITEQVYALSAVQLRFTSDQQYQVEVMCVQRESDPIVLHQGSLPPFVEKVPGSSGLLFPYNQLANSYIDIRVYGRNMRLQFRDSGASTKPQTPIAVCAGWGYHCCDPITSVPSGSIVPGQVLDCPGGCFSVCKQRPLILSFRSDPQAKYETRTVNVKRNQAVVNFSVIASNPGVTGGVKRVELDYGDGTKDTFSKEQVSISHTYVCTSSVCSYAAKVVAYDADSITSPDVRTSTITVVVE